MALSVGGETWESLRSTRSQRGGGEMLSTQSGSSTSVLMQYQEGSVSVMERGHRHPPGIPHRTRHLCLFVTPCVFLPEQMPNSPPPL
ncbi:hypothetical protein GN956_G3428 [Arapaima gigas]